MIGGGVLLASNEKCWVVRSGMMFADLRVMARRAYGVVLPMPMRKDVKTTACEACSLPMGQEPTETSSSIRWTWE